MWCDHSISLYLIRSLVRHLEAMVLQLHEYLMRCLSDIHTSPHQRKRPRIMVQAGYTIRIRGQRIYTNTVLVCMCCIVQGICLRLLLAVTVIHCWSSGFLTTFCSTRSPKWLVGTHCTSTGPPTAYWGWTSTWVGGTGDEVEVNMGGVEWGG